MIDSYTGRIIPYMEFMSVLGGYSDVLVSTFYNIGDTLSTIYYNKIFSASI